MSRCHRFVISSSSWVTRVTPLGGVSPQGCASCRTASQGCTDRDVLREKAQATRLQKELGRC
eukprot:3833186-Amphidinium_carterae.2